MSAPTKLRPYQQTLIDKIKVSFCKGNDHIGVRAPVGMGIYTMLSSMLDDATTLAFSLGKGNEARKLNVVIIGILPIIQQVQSDNVNLYHCSPRGLPSAVDESIPSVVDLVIFADELNRFVPGRLMHSPVIQLADGPRPEFKCYLEVKQYQGVFMLREDVRLLA